MQQLSYKGGKNWQNLSHCTLLHYCWHQNKYFLRISEKTSVQHRWKTFSYCMQRGDQHLPGRGAIFQKHCSLQPSLSIKLLPQYGIETFYAVPDNRGTYCPGWITWIFLYFGTQIFNMCVCVRVHVCVCWPRSGKLQTSQDQNWKLNAKPFSFHWWIEQYETNDRETNLIGDDFTTTVLRADADLPAAAFANELDDLSRTGADAGLPFADDWFGTCGMCLVKGCGCAPRPLPL